MSATDTTPSFNVWEIRSERIKSRGMKDGLFALHPIYALHSRHQTEILDVVCNNRQSIMEGCCTNQYVKLANLFSLVPADFVQCTMNLSVFLKHIANVIDCYISTQYLRLLNMTIIIATINSSVCQLCKSDLRSTKILAANLSRVFRNTISFMEVFNPCASVKNKLLHQSSKLISRINTLLRPSLMAASIRAASSGSSAQQPHRLQNSRSFSSSVISDSTTSSLFTIDVLNKATNSNFTVSLRPFSVSQYRRLIGEWGVKTVPFIFFAFQIPRANLQQRNDINK